MVLFCFSKVRYLERCVFLTPSRWDERNRCGIALSFVWLAGPRGLDDRQDEMIVVEVSREETKGHFYAVRMYGYGMELAWRNRTGVEER